MSPQKSFITSTTGRSSISGMNKKNVLMFIKYVLLSESRYMISDNTSGTLISGFRFDIDQTTSNSTSSTYITDSMLTMAKTLLRPFGALKS